MREEHLFLYILPLLGGVLLALLAIDLMIGKRDRKARRARVVLAGIVTAAEVALIVWRILHTSHPDPYVTQSHTPLVEGPPSKTALATEAHLGQAEIPVYEPKAVQAALGLDDPETAPPTPSPGHQVGDRRPFRLEGRPLEAELLHVNGPVYAWLAPGVDVNQEALQDAVDHLAIEIVPAVRHTFGPALPQTDTPALHILNYHDPTDGTSGFYTPDSGVFHINLARHIPTEASYVATLVHQLQHAYHWVNDPNEERWLDEGLSELAQRMSGFDPGRSDEILRQAFDTQLNHWPYGGEGEPPAAHYGASYRFLLYLWERFGDEFIQDLSRHPANGLASIDEVLAVHQAGVTADSIFGDWVLANAVDEGEYQYEHEDWEASLPTTWTETTFYRYPAVIQSAVHPYAADYYRLENTHPSVIRFNGATEAQLLPTPPHSGEFCWWSNAAHHSNTRLTRRVDLSALSSATLRFWTWYDLESEGSRVYLSASRDAGQTWTLLHTYDRRSSGWVEQQLDLSTFAGAQVDLRFDSVTRHGTLDRGFLLDDLTIAELGLEDACEEVGDWQATGFVLAGERIPVRWRVQVIDVYREGHPIQVYQMTLDSGQTGQMQVDFRPLGGLLGNNGRGILAISALARGTTEPLPYHCEIVRQ